MLTASGQAATDGLIHARHGSLLLPAASLVSRRRLLGAAITAGCCAQSSAHAQGAADKTLRILDAIGNLPLTVLGFELYTKEHPNNFNQLKSTRLPRRRSTTSSRRAQEPASCFRTSSWSVLIG